MLRLRLTIDCQARTKKGKPPQTTTGVARTSSAQLMTAGDSADTCSGRRSSIAMATRGIVSAVLTQNRLVMSTSSGFGDSAFVTVRGSSAIPQIGQLPGPFLTIWGCMGHVYSAADAFVSCTFGRGSSAVGKYFSGS